ncbi:MAG: CaiB/BaiF CoA transferase family protein [Kiloniellales bacterium]
MDILGGIKIISFNHFLIGPVGIQLLADLGAEVIAVEPLDGAFQRKWGGANKSVGGQTVLLLAGNRNKRSLALDLKAPAGLEIARRLIAGADVVAENYRPGVMDKLGLGYERLKADNPGLIYAAVSGFGPDGPYAERPGQDLLIQAISGLMDITGSRTGGARAVGVSAADHHGAALLAMGILAALLRRSRTGQGCRVDVDLLSSAIDLQLESFVCYLNGERPKDVRQPRHIAGWYFPAPYGIYPTKDGEMAISLASMKLLSEALSLPELASVSEPDTFARNEELAQTIARTIAGKATAEWREILDAHGVWHAQVNDYQAVIEDPQVRHNGNFVTIDGATGAAITLVRHPVRYDGQAPEVRLPPQPLGAQTADILAELGYSAEEIKALAAESAVGLAGREAQ